MTKFKKKSPMAWVFLILILCTLIIETRIDLKLKHSVIPLVLSFLFFVPNKTTWKIGIILSCWGVINLLVTDQYAAEPTIFHFGYFLMNYHLSFQGVSLDVLMLWWFPIYFYIGSVIVFLKIKKSIV